MKELNKKELNENQALDTRPRSARKGKIETPPLMTDEDEAALDAAWKAADSGGDALAVKPLPKK